MAVDPHAHEASRIASVAAQCRDGRCPLVPYCTAHSEREVQLN